MPHTESSLCFQMIREQTKFVSNISKRLFIFLYFRPSISTHIIFVIPSVHLTEEWAGFSGFAPNPNCTVPRSTSGWKGPQTMRDGLI